MSLLSGLSTPADVAEEKDTLGGGQYQVDSGVYDALIEYAFVEKNDKGTLMLHLGAKLDNGFDLKQRIALTKRTGETFYTTKSGEKFPMSGFVVGEAIALFGAQKQLSELATKPSVVKLYSKEHKKEMPQEVPMITDLLNKPIKLGLKKIIKPSGSYDSDGKWVEDQSKTFTFNEIDKVFHPKSGLTVPEIRSKKTEPEFLEAWKAKWDGKVDDQTDGTAASADTASTTSGSESSVSSLFRN